MKKIMLVFGTRPEAIKMAPVVAELKKCYATCQTVICVTAQHREMLDQVLSIFDIKPDYDLGVMSKGQDLFDITSNCLGSIKKVLFKEKPDMVVVQGDTTSALVAALAAFYCRIPIAHIEAGLRTYHKYSPYPEEVNRRLVGGIADIHFAPTEWSKKNLVKEGVHASKVFVVGNTVVDALLAINRKQKSKAASNYWKEYFQKTWGLTIPDKRKKIILVTGHRRENFGESFKKICFALKDLAKQENVSIVYPVHLNPNVQLPVKTILDGVDNVHLISPLEYESFIYLMNHSCLILTDSGGIQEEAPSLGKPVLVMRDTTERPEGIKAGVVKLVGTSKEDIVKHTLRLLNNEKSYIKMSKAVNPYGDGKSAKRIVKILKVQ